MLPGLLEKYLCSLVRYTYFWLVFACLLNYLLLFFFVPWVSDHFIYFFFLLPYSFFSFFCLYILYLGVVCSSIPPSFFPFFALSHDFLFFSYIWIALLFFLNHFSLSIHEVIVSFVTTSTWIFIFFFNRIRYEAVYQLGSTATNYHH